MLHIIPGILTSNLQLFQLQLELAHGKFPWVQIDFLDGEFAENHTVKPFEINLDPFPNIKFEAHLMVAPANLLTWATDCLEAGFDRLVVQIESMTDQTQLLELVEFSASQFGISLDSHTSVEEISTNLFEQVNVIQIMTIKAGFQGQQLIPQTLDKVKQLIQLRNKHDYKWKITLDGGINEQSIPILKNLDIDNLIIGSGFFENIELSKELNQNETDLNLKIQKFQNLIKS